EAEDRLALGLLAEARTSEHATSAQEKTNFCSEERKTVSEVTQGRGREGYNVAATCRVHGWLLFVIYWMAPLIDNCRGFGMSRVHYEKGKPFEQRNTCAWT